MSYTISRIIEASYKNAISTNNKFNSYEINVPPIHLPKGATIQIDGSIVEEKSASTDVIELSNYNYSKEHPYISSVQTLEFLYYINHNGMNSVPLPYSAVNGYKIDDNTNKNEDGVFQKSGSLIEAVDWLDSLTLLDAWTAAPKTPDGMGGQYPYGGGGGTLDYNNLWDLERSFPEYNNQFNVGSIQNTIADPPTSEEITYKDFFYSVASLTNLIPRNKYDSSKFVRVNPTFTQPSGVEPLVRYTTQTEINLSDDLLETPEELSFKINSQLTKTEVMSKSDTLEVLAPRMFDQFKAQEEPVFNMTGQTVKNIPCNGQTTYNRQTGEYYHKIYSNMFVEDIDKAEGGIEFLRCSTWGADGIVLPNEGINTTFENIFRNTSGADIDFHTGTFSLDFEWSNGWENDGFYAVNTHKPNVNTITDPDGLYNKESGEYLGQLTNGLNVVLETGTNYYGLILQMNKDTRNLGQLLVEGSSDNGGSYSTIQNINLNQRKYDHYRNVEHSYIIIYDGLVNNPQNTTWDYIRVNIQSLIPENNGDDGFATVYLYQFGVLGQSIEECAVLQANWYPCIMALSNPMTDVNSHIYNWYINQEYEIHNYEGNLPPITLDFNLNGVNNVNIQYPNIAWGEFENQPDVYILWDIREMPNENKQKRLALCVLFAEAETINGEDYITPLTEPFMYIPLEDSYVRDNKTSIPAFLITDIHTYQFPPQTGLDPLNFHNWNKEFQLVFNTPLTFCSLGIEETPATNNMSNSIYNGLPYEALLGTNGGGQFADDEGADRDKKVNEFLAIPDKMLIPTNINNIDDNLRRIQTYFRKIERYIGTKTTYAEQQNDSLGWIADLDIGMSNGRLNMIMRNVEPSNYIASVDVNNGSWYPNYYPNMISKEQRVDLQFDLSRMYQVYPKNKFSNNGMDIQTDKNYIRVYTRYNESLYENCKISNFDLRNRYPTSPEQGHLIVPDNANPRYDLAEYDAYLTENAVNYTVFMDALDDNNWTATFTINGVQTVINLTNTTTQGQNIGGTLANFSTRYDYNGSSWNRSLGGVAVFSTYSGQYDFDYFTTITFQNGNVVTSYWKIPSLLQLDYYVNETDQAPTLSATLNTNTPFTLNFTNGSVWTCAEQSGTIPLINVGGVYTVDNTQLLGATITLNPTIGNSLVFYAGTPAQRESYTNLARITLPTLGGGESITPALGLSTNGLYRIDEQVRAKAKELNIPFMVWEWENQFEGGLQAIFTQCPNTMIGLFNYGDTIRGNGGIPTATPENPFPKPLDNVDYRDNLPDDITDMRTCFRILCGEWVGYDPDFTTNRAVIPINQDQSVGGLQEVQKLKDIGDQGKEYETQKYSIQVENYLNYIWIGAVQPIINFELSRFNFKQFHTPNIFSVQNGNLEQAGQIISYFNFNEPNFKSFYGFNQANPERAGLINTNNGIFDSLSGIGINNIYVRNERSPDLIKCYYEGDNVFNYQYSLLSLLGFKLKQLLPLYGSQSKRFSNSKYNAIDIVNRYAYTSFFTTNGQVSQGNSQSLSLFSITENNTPPSPPATTPPVLRGLPSYQLSYLGFQPFALATESAVLRAEELSAKLQFPFYLIETNLPSNGYYTNNNMLNINAYCFRQYKASNMWFSYASSYDYTLTQEIMLSNIKIRIYNSNNRLAENIGANSTVFIKISAPATLPQLVEPPPEEDLLLRDIDKKLDKVVNSQNLTEIGGEGAEYVKSGAGVKKGYKPRVRRTKKELAEMSKNKPIDTKVLKGVEGLFRDYQIKKLREKGVKPRDLERRGIYVEGFTRPPPKGAGRPQPPPSEARPMTREEMIKRGIVERPVAREPKGEIKGRPRD